MKQALVILKTATLLPMLMIISVCVEKESIKVMAQSQLRYQNSLQYFQRQSGQYMTSSQHNEAEHKLSPYGAAIPYYPVTPYRPIASHPAHPLRLAQPMPKFVRTATGKVQPVGSKLGIKSRPVADPAYLSFAIGRTDVTKGDETVDFRLEYRHNASFYIFKPFMGIDVSGDGAFYGFFGILTDLYFGKKRNFIVTPNFAVGVYGAGDGKRLGYPLEFRSGIEFAYRFEDKSRLGFSIHHISNANIGEKNPGTESVVVNYAIPFDHVLNWMP